MRRISTIVIQKKSMCDSPVLQSSSTTTLQSSVPLFPCSHPTESYQPPTRQCHRSYSCQCPPFLFSPPMSPRLFFHSIILPQFSIPFHRLDVLTPLLFLRIPHFPILGLHFAFLQLPRNHQKTPSGLRLLHNLLQTIHICLHTCQFASMILSNVNAHVIGYK